MKPPRSPTWRTACSNRRWRHSHGPGRCRNQTVNHGRRRRHHLPGVDPRPSRRCRNVGGQALVNSLVERLRIETGRATEKEKARAAPVGARADYLKALPRHKLDGLRAGQGREGRAGQRSGATACWWTSPRAEKTQTTAGSGQTPSRRRRPSRWTTAQKRGLHRLDKVSGGSGQWAGSEYRIRAVVAMSCGIAST